MMRRLLVVWLILGAGCSSGDVDPAGECGAQGECPPGYTCEPVSRRCILSGGDAGAGFALSLTIEGGGAVVVSGAPSACTTGSCSFNFTSGTTVTLTAQPPPGASFVGWSGACAGSQPVVTVQMDADKACTATFGGARLTVAGAVSGASGAVTATSPDPGAVCAGASCTIQSGGSVTLSAPAIPGFRFAGWTGGGGCSGTSPVVQLTNVTISLSCTATYVAGVTVSGTAVGATATIAATSTSPGAVCVGGSCTVGAGATVTLTAPMLSGFRFAGWSGGASCASAAPSLTVASVTEDVACTAGYVQRFTVTGTAAGTAAAVVATSSDLTATCQGSSCVVDERGRATLAAPAVEGFRFAGWSGDCAGSDNPLLVTNVTSDRTCTATYVPRVLVSATVSGGPSQPVLAMSGQPAAMCGAGSCVVDVPGDVTLLAPVAVGYRFVSWSGTAACAGSSNPLVLIAVTQPQVCVATYLPRVTITGVVSGMAGVVTASSADALADCSAGNACSVDVPGNVTLTAPPPAEGTTFKGWGGVGCTGGSRVLQLAGQTASRTCTALYTRRVTVSVAAAPAGLAVATFSSTSSTAECTTTECTVDAGEHVRLHVEGGDNLRFVGWDGVPCAAASLDKLVDLALQVEGSCTATFVDFRTSDRPLATSRWGTPTGWLDEEREPIAMPLRAVAGARYECRTGRTRVAGPSHYESQLWRACDGGSGLTPVVYGLPVDGDPNGSYRTEVRLAIVAYRSASLVHEYYAHDSLDGARRCPVEATDAEILAAVNQLELPYAYAFAADDVVANPFVRLTLSFGIYNHLAKVGTPLLPSPFAFDVLSLRHGFRLLSRGLLPRRYLVVRREFESSRQLRYRGVSSCLNTYDFGWKWVVLGGKLPGNPRQQRLHCAALVMNAQGRGHCLARDAQGVLRSIAYSNTAWEKLLQAKSFSPKNRAGCTTEGCGLYLPD
jgi:hypothetical protein